MNQNCSYENSEKKKKEEEHNPEQQGSWIYREREYCFQELDNDGQERYQGLLRMTRGVALLIFRIWFELEPSPKDLNSQPPFSKQAPTVATQVRAGTEEIAKQGETFMHH